MVDVVSASTVPKREHYSLNDIAELVIEAHSCLHRVDQKIDEHRVEVAKDFGAIGQRVAKLEGKTEAVGQRVGVKFDADEQKPAWFPSPFQILVGVGSAAGGLVVVYKFVAAALPALHKAIMALN